jgi:cell division protein FtsB
MKRQTTTSKLNYKPSLVIVLGIILVSAMVAQLAFLSVFGTKGKEVANIRTEQKRLILENELLEAEISEKQSLARIKKVATEELGMVNVGEVEYISPSTTVSAKNKTSE